MKSKILDIAAIERPVLMQKPEKPRKIDSDLQKTKTEKAVYWSSSAEKKFKILDVLKNIPKDVDLNDVQIWHETKMSGSIYSYDRKPSATMFLGLAKEIPNPKYVAANKKYETELATYNEKFALWESNQAEYNDKLELYKKYKDLVDVRDQKTALMKKLASLAAKEPMQVVQVVKP